MNTGRRSKTKIVTKPIHAHAHSKRMNITLLQQNCCDVARAHFYTNMYMYVTSEFY